MATAGDHVNPYFSNKRRGIRFGDTTEKKYRPALEHFAAWAGARDVAGSAA